MRIRALAALSSLTLLLTGCGGDDQPQQPRVTLQATLTRTDTLLSWSWTLRNDDTEAIVILDGPITGGNQPQVWVTPRDDGTIEAAYRFLAPPEGVAVARPILQAGHTVAAGASATGTALVRLPLTVRHPYAGAFDPPLALPGGTPDIAFCVGAVRAKDVAPQPGGSYAHLESAAAKQRVTCADS
jgi:hypothetical protein